MEVVLSPHAVSILKKLQNEYKLQATLIEFKSRALSDRQNLLLLMGGNMYFLVMSKQGVLWIQSARGKES